MLLISLFFYSDRKNDNYEMKKVILFICVCYLFALKERVKGRQRREEKKTPVGFRGETGSGRTVNIYKKEKKIIHLLNKFLSCGIWWKE